jgi:mannose-6-phosphate isomerase-like protein (cupin superfamily)
MIPRRYEVIDFAEIPPVDCPCGSSRRALADSRWFPGTVHRTEISADAKPHFHHRLTETYYILDCDPGATLELDGDRLPLRPGLCIVIPHGTVHRAVGKISILNIVHPKFDPADEVLVEDDGSGIGDSGWEHRPGA